jgi:tRNA(Ile)-lysidine synthase
MAGSLTPKPKPASTGLPRPLTRGSAGPSVPVNPAQSALALFSPDQLTLPLAVAYSGGADSTALLHAASARWPGQVTALHVHHGLQQAADGFEASCRAVCSALSVPLQVLRINARHQAGESPEDAARKARYAALADGAKNLGLHAVLLGQHADDQVETLLLALSRGAGLAGLSAMPVTFERGGMLFCRPLLEVPAASLRAWLEQQGHAFVDDPSNADERFTRNLIRARLLPALAQAFPQFRQTFARSAAHAAQAQALLEEVAAQDLSLAGQPPAIAVVQSMSKARQANVLRHWLRTVHGATPSAAQLAQLLEQVAACTTRGHRIHLKVANGHVLRAAGCLQWQGPI